MSNGLYAFISQHTLELSWLNARALGPSRVVTVSEPIDLQVAPDEGLRHAFLAAALTLRCPNGLPVVWVAPPDVAGVLCAIPQAGAATLSLPLPFADVEVKRADISADSSTSATLWVHINWVSVLEEVAQAAGHFSLLVVSRAQFMAGCAQAADATAAPVVWALDCQGNDAYLHAYGPTGGVLRSVALPGPATESPALLTMAQEAARLAHWVGVSVDAMPPVPSEVTAWSPRNHLRRLQWVGGGTVPGIDLAGKATLLQRMWQRYLTGHVVLAMVLVAVAVGGGWLQQHTLAQLEDGAAPLRAQSLKVQGIQRQATRLEVVSSVIAAGQHKPDTRLPLVRLVETLPSQAHVVRVGVSLEGIEFDLQFADQGLAAAFSLSLPGYGPIIYADGGAGIAKYSLQSEHVQKSTSLKGTP